MEALFFTGKVAVLTGESEQGLIIPLLRKSVITGRIPSIASGFRGSGRALGLCSVFGLILTPPHLSSVPHQRCLGTIVWVAVILKGHGSWFTQNVPPNVFVGNISLLSLTVSYNTVLRG